MNDMSAVIIPKSDQINADSLIAGPMTITVTEVGIRPGTEQPVTVRYEGDDGRPFKPCKSMCKVMVACWGADASLYTGRAMTLFCDPDVKWGGLAVGGIRISHMSHIEKERVLMLTETKGKKKPLVVKPLVVEAPQPKQDAVATATERLIARVNDCATEDALHDLAGDPKISEWRGKLAQQRPELEKRIADAFGQRYAALVADTAPTPDAAGMDALAAGVPGGTHDNLMAG